MQRKSLATLISFAAMFVIAAAISASANPVEAHFVGLGGQNQNGEYTYPYYVTLDNGQQISMACDDFYHASNVGDTWQANITALSSGDLSKTRFNDLGKYQEAGFLLLQINPGDEQEWGNINFAIWEIFNPGVNAGDPPAGTLGAAYWLNLAQTANLSSVDFSSIMILTPVDAHSETGDQEFLFATPEPGTLVLIGSGMLGLFSQRKRFV